MAAELRVGLLWREEWDPPGENGPDVTSCKLHGVFAAFSELGVEAEPVVYSDERLDVVREQLLRLDGVLVWVNPIEKGLDRSRLDPLLREVAASGAFVSAHPDVILRLGTKEVLVDTRSMSWGTDTHVYRAWPSFGAPSRNGSQLEGRSCSSSTAEWAGRASGRSSDSTTRP